MSRFGFGGGLLRRNRDFSRLFLSSSIQAFTGQFSDFAMPVLAILLFHATPFQVGLLVALEIIPLPILSLFVGVWVDSRKRLGIIIACNIARMISLGSIPVSYLLGALTLNQIFAVVLITGAFEVVARTAYSAYTPSVVQREDLQANQLGSTTGSASSVVGPGIAGYLYQFVGGAYSIAIDSFGFLVSAILLRRNKEDSFVPHIDDAQRSFFSKMRKGPGVHPRKQHAEGGRHNGDMEQSWE